ncbi:MAG: polymer-forming cytoskeletal protein [Lachnospiraceae bacterium]|nr:polymer-forming cytoskeletal protein [Lachnospiraceae bacterium]
MGFFQSLKDDLSEAVDGIFDEEDTDEVSGSGASGAEDTFTETSGETEADDLDLDDLAALLDAVKSELPDEENAGDTDEDYTPATPEEIAAFESSSDDDENAEGDLFDPAELDKLMADIASMEEAGSTETAEEENAKPAAETDSADIPDQENAEAAAEADNAEEKAPGEEDKTAEETFSEETPSEETPSEEAPAEDKSAEEAPSEEASGEDKPAEEKTAEEKPAKEKASEEEPAEEKASEEEPAEEKTSEDKAPEEKAAEEKPADEDKETADTENVPDAGEQMTISQMMGIEEENTEVIKQAEAMAEAAAIADIKEAEETAKAEAEAAATAERVAEFEVDAKPRKKARRKVSKADKADKADNRARIEAGPRTVSDETAVFAEGMSVKGDVESDGSLELSGVIEGNIDIAGKLKVSGIIKGNTTAGELYADGAEINGNITCSGSVKVGQSTIIIGDITGSSAVIAGAVKGNIDVHGPVILDSVAIVMGDIRSQSLQISNGAAVEGMCSQIYSPVTPADFFGDK